MTDTLVQQRHDIGMLLWSRAKYRGPVVKVSQRTKKGERS